MELVLISCFPLTSLIKKSYLVIHFILCIKPWESLRVIYQPKAVAGSKLQGKLSRSRGGVILSATRHVFWHFPRENPLEFHDLMVKLPSGKLP